MGLEGINLLDVNMFVQGREYDAFRRLRDEAPVYFHREPDGPGFHAVTRFDDVVDVVRRPLVFCSGGGTQIQNRKAEGHGTASVHNSDPPYHTQLRNAVLPSFRAGLMQNLTPKIRATVQRLIDDCPRGEPFDFVAHFAVKLPMMVIGDLMGVRTTAPDFCALTTSLMPSSEASPCISFSTGRRPVRQSAVSIGRSRRRLMPPWKLPVSFLSSWNSS